MKIDPYKHKEKYKNWQQKVSENGQIKGITQPNSDIILKFLNDMELGINISSTSVKGELSFT